MDLKNKIDPEVLYKNQNKFRRIFFYRICGTGMGATACLLKEKGYEIEGGDLKFYPPMGDYLKSTGIPCRPMSDVTEEYLKTFDLIVVGNVVAGSSPEARMIEKTGIPFVSFPSALGALVLRDLEVVGVAGTHGKTTTTYFLVQLFEKLGHDPGYFIGGVIDGRPSSRLGSGKYFFIESDEYDSAYFEKISKFRLYYLNHMILTSLEFDHGDIFADVAAIKREFNEALPQINKSVVYSTDYPAAKELHQAHAGKMPSRKWTEYGESQKNRPKILSMDSKGTEFSIFFDERDYKFKTNISGEHNILNLTACILFAAGIGISMNALADCVKQMDMVKRRQEERGKFMGSLVIDDFAHHPRAVKSTIDSIRAKYPKKKIIAVFEGSSATARSDIFQKEFAEALAAGDCIITVKPEKPTSIRGVGNIDCQQLAKDIKNLGKEVHVVETLPALREKMQKLAAKDALFLVMSNGTCLGLWESDFVGQLK